MQTHVLEQFEARTGRAFGAAIEHCRRGGRAARRGWNGKDMWITYGQGRTIPGHGFWNPNTKAFAMSQPSQEVDVLPYFILKTADDKILMGWLASQTDMLAMDWDLLDPL